MVEAHQLPRLRPWTSRSSVSTTGTRIPPMANDGRPSSRRLKITISPSASTRARRRTDAPGSLPPPGSRAASRCCAAPWRRAADRRRRRSGRRARRRSGRKISASASAGGGLWTGTRGDRGVSRAATARRCAAANSSGFASGAFRASSSSISRSCGPRRSSESRNLPTSSSPSSTSWIRSSQASTSSKRGFADVWRRRTAQPRTRASRATQSPSWEA